ncbi:MAG: hypothetical protein HUU35_19440 [Armatimonadetes bacterium]|nr:hypothetical protein [Armatimonadota bacterium]
MLARRWLLSEQALALLSAVGAGLAAYWQEAPGVMRVAVLSLGPLLLADSLSAGWLQRRMLARRGLSASQLALLAALDPGDTWRRTAVRFGMTLLLVVLAGVADAITGTPHMTVCWVLLWACGGHGQQTLRRLRVLARLEGFELPIFPDGTWDKVQPRPGPAPGPREAPAEADPPPAV